jgi:hypothetical protein
MWCLWIFHFFFKSMWIFFHNILYLMVNPRFKIFHLYIFINHEEGVIIVKKIRQEIFTFYVSKVLSSFTFNCRIWLWCVKQTVEENCNLEFFKQIVSTTKLAKELAIRKLLNLKHYQVNPKKIKCTLQWWGKHETMFLKIGFLACQIIGIVKSQIVIWEIFFFNGHTY